MTRRTATWLLRGRTACGLLSVLLVSLGATLPLLAASAKDLYTAALRDERALRAPAGTPPTLAHLRDAIRAYNEVVRQYPRSGYSDNALWQAAGLAILAFDRHRQPAERASGERFLRLLEREYPSSSLVSRVADRLAELRRLNAPVQISAGRDEPVQLRAIHRELLDDVVRVTIELDDEVRYDTERLDAPARVFFDFRGTDAAPALRNTTLAFDDGDMVREIRLGRHPGQTTRVVLDIEDVEEYSVYSIYNPYRLVIDTIPTAVMQARRATPDRAASPVVMDDTPAPSPSAPHVTQPPAVDEAGELSRTAEAVALEGASAVSTGEDASTRAVASVGPEMAPEGAERELPGAQAQDLPPPSEGWAVRRLDPIPPALDPGTTNPLETAPAITTQAAKARQDPVAAPEPPVDERIPVSVEARHEGSEDGRDARVWPDVHRLLYPEFGGPRPHEPDARQGAADEVPVTPSRTDDAIAWVSETRFGRLGAVTPTPFVLPETTVAIATVPRLEPATLTARPGAPEPDVVRSDRDATSGQNTERAVANSDGDFSLGRQLGLGVSRIVIDPGHGGYDPGAQTGGLTESALVLDVAIRLAARLEAETGIEAILTRRRDTYMPLRARTELANRVGADLFLSIHANAATDRTARGIETYYLDLATNADTQMVAARENATSRDGMHDLPKLVQSITQHNKMDESRDLAQMVQRHLVRAVRELHPDAQDLGVKQAPFVVLIGANMPSVLAEISFLTNQEDAAFLATDAYRNQIADALLRSILEYQQALKPQTSFVAGNN